MAAMDALPNAKPHEQIVMCQANRKMFMVSELSKCIVSSRSDWGEGSPLLEVRMGSELIHV